MIPICRRMISVCKHVRSIHSSTKQIGSIFADSNYYKGLERQYGSINYSPVVPIITRGFKSEVWDIHGHRYLDFLACYATLNQGHCHPHVVAAATKQMQKLTLSSRVFYNDTLGEYQQLMCNTFGYERHFPANGGCEAVESAIKMARRWGYDIKGIPRNDGLVVVPNNNYWGRSISAISSSTNPSTYNGFGPYTRGFMNVAYDDTAALETLFQRYPHICAYVLEIIQGEAGVIVPADGYIAAVRRLCTKYNVLMIADEVQTGLGRTGYLAACEVETVKPDLITFGKALSAGFMPISCVMGREDVICSIKSGENGSTFGGNPLSCAIGTAAVEVILNENLCEQSQHNGAYLHVLLEQLRAKYGNIIVKIHGRGLMIGIEIDQSQHNIDTICKYIVAAGVLVKPTHGKIIRISPPLAITRGQIEEGCQLIEAGITQYIAERKS